MKLSDTSSPATATSSATSRMSSASESSGIRFARLSRREARHPGTDLGACRLGHAQIASRMSQVPFALRQPLPLPACKCTLSPKKSASVRSLSTMVTSLRMLKTVDHNRYPLLQPAGTSQMPNRIESDRVRLVDTPANCYATHPAAFVVGSPSRPSPDPSYRISAWGLSDRSSLGPRHRNRRHQHASNLSPSRPKSFPKESRGPLFVCGCESVSATSCLAAKASYHSPVLLLLSREPECNCPRL